MKFLNARGITLIELMIATAGLTGAILLVSQVTNTIFQSTALADSKYGQIKLQKDLRDVLTRQDSCFGVFSGQNLTPNADTDFAVSLPNGVRVSGAATDTQPIDFYGVKVTSLRLTKKQRVTTLSNGDPVYSTVLVLGSQSVRGNTSLPFAPTALATIYFRTDPSNKIADCLVGDDPTTMAKLTCDSLGGKLDAAGNCRVSASITSVACADGEYLKGFDSDGNKDCRKFGSPAPTTPSCTTKSTTVGAGNGSSPRVWPDPCNNSCQGTFGPSAHCAGGCYSGARGWYYCGTCVKDVETCN